MTVSQWAKSTGLKQIQLAKLTGVKQPTLSEILRGKCNCSPRVAMIFRKVSGGKVTLEEALFNIECHAAAQAAK